jgi:hypothetical protein
MKSMIFSLASRRISHLSILQKHTEDPVQLTLTGRYHKAGVSLARATGRKWLETVERRAERKLEADCVRVGVASI